MNLRPMFPWMFMAGLLLLTACGGKQAVPTMAPPLGAEPQQPPPSGPGDLQIAFTADRAQINPGECATLQWQVSGPHFATLLNGEPVSDAGSKQVCPPDDQLFLLQVDLGDQMTERAVSITVGGSTSGGAPPAPPSGSGPAGSPPTPGGGPAGGAIIAPPPTVSASVPDLVLAAVGLGGSSGNDIIVSVRNEGTEDLINSALTVLCSWEPRDAAPGSAPLPMSSAVAETNFSLKVGQSANFTLITSGGLDSNKEEGSYQVSCSITTNAAEADTTNNAQEVYLP